MCFLGASPLPLLSQWRSFLFLLEILLGEIFFDRCSFFLLDRVKNSFLAKQKGVVDVSSGNGWAQDFCKVVVRLAALRMVEVR